jgi:23S rRNA pseudouridine2605 synthase
MKDGMKEILVPCGSTAISRYMDGNGDQHKSGERIAKVIARAGLASRREAELWIAAGRVAVNGTLIASPACNVTERDRVTVDGEPLPARQRTRLFLYHKPRGLMTSHADPQGRPTIFARLPQNLPRLISVGRLDFNTEGLLLLTNDGALARVLELPATGWLRRYRVRAHGAVTQQKLDELHAGVTISGVHYGPIEAALDRVQGSNLWLTFAIREGKNHEVRNVLAHLGLMVTRLIRVSFGPFQLGELAEGAVEEVPTRVLREQLGARLVAASGADFSTPIAAPPPLQQRDGQRGIAGEKRASDEKKPAGRKSTNHVWRAREEEQPKKLLRRKYRGARREDAAPRHQPAAPVRADVLMDRKGRRVPVERHGQPPVKERRGERPNKSPPKRGRRRAPDRASGARPRQPRGR